MQDAKGALAIDSPSLAQGTANPTPETGPVNQPPGLGQLEDQDVVIRFVRSAKSQSS